MGQTVCLSVSSIDMAKDLRIQKSGANHQQMRFRFDPVNVMGMPLESMNLNQLNIWFEEGLTVSTGKRSQVRRLLSIFQYDRCFYCYRNVRGVGSPRQRTIDHIIPLAKGGRDLFDNVCLCCLQCNGKKGDLLLEEFVETSYFAEQYKTRFNIGVYSDGSIANHLGKYSILDLVPWFVDLRFPELFPLRDGDNQPEF
jgi:hypothetical protein